MSASAEHADAIREEFFRFCIRTDLAKHAAKGIEHGIFGVKMSRFDQKDAVFRRIGEMMMGKLAADVGIGACRDRVADEIAARAAQNKSEAKRS